MKRVIWLTILILLLAACQNDSDPTPVPSATETPTDTASATNTDSAVTTPPAVADEAAAAVEATVASETDPEPTATAPPTLLPSPTPLPETELVICTGAEPRDLYLYGDNSLAATAVRHAIYENLYTTLDYDYQAQALTKMPSLADGDAFLQETTVTDGDWVINANGGRVQLIDGEQLVNVNGETVTFNEGDEVVMPQLVVNFTVEPMTWSDGTAVSTADYLFSFDVAANLASPTDKTITDRTESFVGTSDTSMSWTGIPGYLNPTYFTNIWSPLPSHQLQQYTAAELLAAPEASQLPLSNGPFMLEAWEAGVEIRLVRNPHYYRLNQGLPQIGRLTFRFVDDAAPLLADATLGGCDVVMQDLLDITQLDAITGSGATLHTAPSQVYEQISFGVDSIFDYANLQPDWFELAQMRQAIAMCTDRQRMVDELTGGYGEIVHAYIPNQHPLFPVDAIQWSYDPAAANGLLDEIGFQDYAGDGRRQDVATGTTMTVTLGTHSESPLRQQINTIFQENMRDCGIVVELYDRSAGTWFGDGPGGPVFGRRFDLAELGWLARPQPTCNLYLSENITGPESSGLGGWGNVNVTGWSNEAYDTACRAAEAALPGLPEYVMNHQTAVRIFTDELPALPLFTRVKLTAAHPSVQNILPNSSQRSELWNVFEWDLQE
ncbi:MAG: ABC transporter substrate-binding protein [Chloroflexota bacterium]